jgi:hypothetical protein
MTRVVRPGGTVAACMWDLADGGMSMLRVFWTALRSAAPTTPGEGPMAGSAEGDIAARFTGAGLTDVTGGSLLARAEYTGFDDFWQPFTYAIGPAGQYLAALPDAQQAQARENCRAALPTGPFSLDARAWCARGTVPAAGE